MPVAVRPKERDEATGPGSQLRAYMIRIEDREPIYNTLKKAQDNGQQLTRTTLEKECAFLAHDKTGRFKAALQDLLKEGAVRETDQKIKIGSFLKVPIKEPVLEAVNPPMEKNEYLRRMSGDPISALGLDKPY
jgi:hypothetical protein